MSVRATHQFVPAGLPAGAARRVLGLLAALVLTATWPEACGQDRSADRYTVLGSDAFPAELGSGRELPQLTDASSVPDYLRYAALNSARLQAAHASWRAAMLRIPQATALPDPKLSYAYYLREVETRVGPQEQAIAISQMFPWFGKLRLRGEIAALEAEAAWQSFEQQRLALYQQVKKSFYEYCYLRRAIDITQATMALVTHLEEVARTAYTGGKPLTAVMQAQIELGRLEVRLGTQTEMRPVLAEKLNALLNRPPGTPLPWPQWTPIGEDLAFSAKQLRDLITADNPKLKRFDILGRRHGTAADLAARNRFPDLTFSVKLIDTDDALSPAARDSGKDPVIAGVTLNIPIWRQKYAAQQDEALARQAAMRSQLLGSRDGLFAESKLALFRFEDAARKLDLYRDTLLPKAEQALEVTREAFTAGKVDFLNLIDAERVLLEFQLALERALIDRAIALSEIELLVGRTLSAPANDIETQAP